MFFRKMGNFYRAQNEAYMCRSAKNAVIGLCFSVLSAT